VETTGLEDLDADERLGDLLGGFVGTQLLYVVT
jgi:hypothetical protein